MSNSVFIFRWSSSIQCFIYSLLLLRLIPIESFMMMFSKKPHKQEDYEMMFETVYNTKFHDMIF